MSVSFLIQTALGARQVYGSLIAKKGVICWLGYMQSCCSGATYRTWEISSGRSRGCRVEFGRSDVTGGSPDCWSEWISETLLAARKKRRRMHPSSRCRHWANKVRCQGIDGISVGGKMELRETYRSRASRSRGGCHAVYQRRGFAVRPQVKPAQPRARSIRR